MNIRAHGLRKGLPSLAFFFESNLGSSGPWVQPAFISIFLCVRMEMLLVARVVLVNVGYTSTLSLSIEASMATEVDDGFGRGAKRGHKMVVGEGLCQG